MRGRRRFFKRKGASEEMTLQITSMADIFTILLVFLLKSFSTGISNITPSNALLLPEAVAQDESAEGLKVEIGSAVILVDDKPVTELQNFRFDESDLESDGTPRSLNAALIKMKGRKPASAATAETPDKPAGPPRMTVMADQRAPYATIKAVFAAAGNNGFGELQLVVVGDH